jgi:hypothetical protein
MSYSFIMSAMTRKLPNSTAMTNCAQLILALEDIGYDGVDVCHLDGGLGLFIDETCIAVGVGDDVIEASEDLLDRAADLFYHSTPEA